MILKGLGTFKSHISDTALSLRVDGQECRLNQSQLVYISMFRS